MIEKTFGATARAASDTAKTTVSTIENIAKKLWSLVDAASEKQKPSEYLSQKAIHSIQGEEQT